MFRNFAVFLLLAMDTSIWVGAAVSSAAKGDDYTLAKCVLFIILHLVAALHVVSLKGKS